LLTMANPASKGEKGKATKTKTTTRKRGIEEEAKPKDKSKIEDSETEIGDNVNIDQEEQDETDADGEDSDSSVYSELEGEKDDDDSEDEDEDEEEDEDEDSDEEDGDEDSDNEHDKVEKAGSSSDEDENVKEKVRRKPKAKTKGNKEEELVVGTSKANVNATEYDEYAYDSSDEEDIRNTMGNIPTNWYDDYDHIGYDLDGRKIRKPKRGDELDAFLRRMEGGDAGITVQDPMTGQDVVLSAKDVEMIRRVRAGKLPDADYDMYADQLPFFSNEVLEMPICNVPETKRSFLPSIDEKRKVGKMVHAIKMGWMKTRAERLKALEEKGDDTQKYYMLWKTDDQVDDDSARRIRDLIPAPKMRLPGHAESYNPPPEYLFTEREKKDWEDKDEEPYKRKLQFIPEKYGSLRKVPAYKKFINERFERCLDLYLAPRARKMRLTIQPEDLVPQLPKPRDLMPFPTGCGLTFKGHKNMVRSLSIEPTGQFMASGSDDGTVRVWEIQTGYCLKTFKLEGVVKSVAWCPNQALSLLAVAVENKVVLINAGAGDKLVVDQTDELISEPPDNTGYVPPERVKAAVTWTLPEEVDQVPSEALTVLRFFKQVKQVTWHGKGDYFATTLTDGANRSVIIHQLSKWRSQLPFSKSKGLVQTILFHPIR
jgi:ribosome biogenesis protein ERB1